MKKLIALLSGLLLAHSLQAAVTLPFYDGFIYSAGATLAGNGSWLAGNGSTQIKIGNAGLSYPGLQASTGIDVSMIPTSSSARTYVNFTAQTNGTVYFSFLLKVNSLPNAQRLIAYGFNSTSSTGSPYLGFFITTSGQLAVGISTSTAQFTSTALNAGSTYLIVAAYTFGVADSAQIWINPVSLGAAAPAPTGSFTASGHNAALSHFHWNTPSAGTGGGSYETDEIRIGSTYASVTPASSPQSPPVTAPVITQALMLPQGFVVRGTNGTSNGVYQVVGSTDITVPRDLWSVLGSGVFDGAGHFDYTNPVQPNLPQTFYLLRVNGATNQPPAIAPSISSQPQNQSAAAGDNALFSVAAAGTAPLHYQWFFNTNTVLPDQTNSTLLLSNVGPADVGGYFVTVTNVAGSTNSIVATLTLTPPPTNGDWFVSPTGNDNNPGSITEPFYSLQKAITLATPGDVIYMRGGTYLYSQTIRLTNSGTALDPIQLLAYPGEHPSLNFSNQPYGSSNRGLLITTNGNYWQLKGLEIAYAGDNAIKVEGSHLRFEQCVLHHNGDTGLQIGFAHETDNPGANLAAFIEVINCDSYMNYDSDNRGSDADGFAAKLHCGQGIVFRGCRSWQNSDDGWDLFETDASVVISNCWTWHNGDGALFPGPGSFQGNGNGFKLGGNGTGGSSEGVHYALNCVSFNNNFPGRTRHGFDQNSHHGGNVVYNCTAWNNLYNYFFEDGAGSNPLELKNNVSFSAGTGNGVAQLPAGAVEQNNSWNLLVSANGADFNSITETEAAAPRLPDGSLPTGFARLVAGSDLIDQGVNVGIPFLGTAPDLGAYEYP